MQQHFDAESNVCAQFPRSEGNRDNSSLFKRAADNEKAHKVKAGKSMTVLAPRCLHPLAPDYTSFLTLMDVVKGEKNPSDPTLQVR